MKLHLKYILQIFTSHKVSLTRSSPASSVAFWEFKYIWSAIFIGHKYFGKIFNLWSISSSKLYTVQVQDKQEKYLKYRIGLEVFPSMLYCLLGVLVYLERQLYYSVHFWEFLQFMEQQLNYVVHCTSSK